MLYIHTCHASKIPHTKEQKTFQYCGARVNLLFHQARRSTSLAKAPPEQTVAPPPSAEVSGCRVTKCFWRWVVFLSISRFIHIFSKVKVDKIRNDSVFLFQARKMLGTSFRPEKQKRCFSLPGNQRGSGGARQIPAILLREAAPSIRNSPKHVGACLCFPVKGVVYPVELFES